VWNEQTGTSMIAAALGWVGTVGTIGAYVLLSRGRWHARSLRYGALNGAAGLVGAAGCTLYGAWPNVASNLLWAGVALHSVVITWSERRAARDAVVTQLGLDREPSAGELPELARAA
jgi:hypothetical protein